MALSFTTGAPGPCSNRTGCGCCPGSAWQPSCMWRCSGRNGPRAPCQRGPSSVLALLTVLLLPVVAVLLLASRSPKFNPRYLMLVSPAYLLLLAGGTRGADKCAVCRHRASRRSGRPRRSWSHWWSCRPSGLRNWFTDPAFTKAQWRLAHVAAEREPDEAVLLVSRVSRVALLYPRHSGGAPAGRRSWMYRRSWDSRPAQRWQRGWRANPVHGSCRCSGKWCRPQGFVPYFLDRAGQERPVDRRFWHLGLRRWQLDLLRPSRRSLTAARRRCELRPSWPFSAGTIHRLASRERR